MDSPDHLAALATVIRTTLACTDDPLVVAALLIEGAAHTVAQHIPEPGQRAAGAAVLGMLMDRLRINGVTD